MSDPLSVFAAHIRAEVQVRLVQAQELAHDAGLIAAAWENQDVDTLVALGLLDEEQAAELRRLVYPAGDGSGLEVSARG